MNTTHIYVTWYTVFTYIMTYPFPWTNNRSVQFKIQFLIKMSEDLEDDSTKLVSQIIIGSGKGLSPVWGQVVTWTNADSLDPYEKTSVTLVWQTCQPLRILRNHYAFRLSNTPLRKPVQNVEKLRILRNFGAIRLIPRNLQQLYMYRLAVSRKSPAGQNIDKGLVYFVITIGFGVRFRHPINKGSCRGETMPNET